MHNQRGKIEKIEREIEIAKRKNEEDKIWIKGWIRKWKRIESEVNNSDDQHCEHVKTMKLELKDMKIQMDRIQKKISRTEREIKKQERENTNAKKEGLEWIDCEKGEGEGED